MGNAVRIDNLSFTYRGADCPALDRLSASVADGSFVVVMGHGGAGKSTLCCTLNGLIPQFHRGRYEGTVTIRGKTAGRTAVAELSRGVGMVFQDFEAQLFCSTVELEMAFGPENRGLTPAEIDVRIASGLDFVGLMHKRRSGTATLSGGEKQRLAIGAVLAAEPDILVLDEATTDLDPEGRREILGLADALRREGRTLIMVDESVETAASADQVWLMKDGCLAASGDPRQVLADRSLLESCGIAPSAPLSLFQALGWPASPLTAEDALAWIDRNPSRVAGRSGSLSCPGGPHRRPLLQAEELSHRYPDSGAAALEGVDLTIGEGEFVAILGRNGSGKTTLAKHFNGLLKPTSGRMLVSGQPTTVCRRHELARRVGYVFQNPDHQIFAPTVRDEVRFGPRVLGEAPQVIERNVAEAMEVTGLTGYEDRIPFLLSRGERQRVAVASVLAVKPQVIVLDEPTTGLDARHQQETMEMLQRLHRLGHTVIIITHAMGIAEAYAERVVLLKEGRILADGHSRRIFADEALLAQASLRPSPLARIGNRLGLRSLTLAGMVQELQEGRG
jgi:energy-coupling factor transport system ATP-binding protein